MYTIHIFFEILQYLILSFALAGVEDFYFVKTGGI
nr:MAG TPA: hypothetical protein [Caudoviricetes sp.]